MGRNDEVGPQSATNIEDIYPLAPMQRGILFHDLLSQGAERPYIQQVLWRMDPSADLLDLRRAWQRVVARHPILRTFVISKNRKEPIQIVCREVTLPWREIDWSGILRDQIASALEAHLAADRAEGFLLTRAPLMRLCAIRLPDGGVQMVWTFHHLLIDGWCLALLLAEVLAAYEAFRQGLHLPVVAGEPYRRFVDWLARRDEAKDRSFWTKLLAGWSGPTSIPGGRHGGGDIVRCATVRWVSRPDTEALNALCARQKLTSSVVVQVAWAVLLSAYAREQDIVFGLTVAGRPPELPDAERIAGLFINSVPVRLRLDAAATILDLLHAAMQQQAGREDHLHAPLAQIKFWAGVAGDATLFDSLLVFENYPIDRMIAKTGARLGISDVRAIDATSFPLTLIVTPGDALELKLLHDATRLSKAEADRLMRILTCVLSGIAADCQRKLSDLPLIDAQERSWLLEAGAGAVRQWGRTELLHRLVEEQAGRSPDAVAVRFAGRDLTFRELDRRANQLAHRLRRLGVGPDRIVGIAMHRSLELVVGLLGILKAGGAFLPIDPGVPAERLAFMVDDSEVPVLLVHAPVAGKLPAHRALTVCLDADWAAVEHEPASTPPGGELGPDHLAYVIYTSGSTGVPKGAMNTHRAICNRLLWMQDAYRLGPDDRVLQKTPCSFDVSVWELFWPLLTGARLVVAEPDGHRDPAYLARVIHEEQITTVHFVPSMLQLFLEQEGLCASCASLRRTICSGEALAPALVDRFFGALPGELHNLYGPAEAAVDVTSWQCRPGAHAKTVPIGRPIANLCIYLFDACGRLVPRGVPGELHIGGVGVGRGYYNRPGLSAEKFITAPFLGAAGSRLYRTGDLAVWREDGELEFLGRFDSQIKLRGMRIDLGEIEAALRAAPAVKEAAAVPERGPAGQDRIVACVTTLDGSSIASSDILDWLRTRLPATMVPSRLVRLDRLPLSANGKLDRKALAAFASVRPGSDPVTPPRSALERAIADVWRGVLCLDSIGIGDNFFELGGTSLLIIPVHTRLRDAWDSTLALVEMFQFPTVEALARRLARGAAPVAPPEIRPATGTERVRRRLGLRARRQAATRGDQPRCAEP
jgi:amino acid adenylation domain-containing protein